MTSNEKLRAELEDAKLLAERRRWGSEELDKVRAERDRYHDVLLERHGGECFALLDELDEAREERDRMRKFLEETRRPTDGFGEEFDRLVALGLLVEVPADDLYREEWGDDEDTMWVWAWLAHEYTGEVTP